MRSWDLSTLEVEAHQPRVLDSEDEGRAILINLPAGQQLKEHQVHERAWVLVVSGTVRIDLPTGESETGGAGYLAVFDPAERHELSAEDDSRLLLVLAPWPGDGHPSQRAQAG
ncbi:MAG TPA: cupin domain-containing protein [Solirubrobacterales bacterium]|nr:cupin domain-containing protein [Solirubrobacterales bacterium]